MPNGVPNGVPTGCTQTSCSSYNPSTQPLSLSMPALSISRNNSLVMNNSPPPPLSLSLAPVSFTSSLPNTPQPTLSLYSSSAAYPYSIETAVPQYGFPSMIKTQSLQSSTMPVPLVNANTSQDNPMNSMTPTIQPHFTPNPYIFYEKKPSFFKDPIFWMVCRVLFHICEPNCCCKL